MNQASFKSGLTRVLRAKELPIVCFTLLVYLLFSLWAPHFNTLNNVSVMLQQAAINGIVALGMTMVIMIGGMDLSVGSLLSLCGVTAGMLDNLGLPLPLVLLLSLLVGGLGGLVNGWLITRLHIPDIIVTLATMNLFRGAAVLLTQSQWITDFSAGFLRIGSGKGGIASIPVLLYALIAVVFAFALYRLPAGRLLYAVGGNREAAALMGLNVDRVKLGVYLVNGLLLGLGGVLFASMFGSIQAATAATGLQFQTMGSALIGGANIFGGGGSVLGTAAGTLLMGIIKNGLVQVHASEYWLDFVTGAVILLALLGNLTARRGRKGGR